MTKKPIPDISQLNFEELRELQAAAAVRENEMREAAKAETRERIDQILKASGFSMVDIYPNLARAWAKDAARNGRHGQVPIKYVDPNNPSNKWTGRGKKPKWFLAAIAAGVPESALLAKH